MSSYTAGQINIRLSPVIPNPMEYNMSISDVTVPNDLDSLWMPFTDNRSFKKQPRLFSEADGMYYFTPDGRKVLDGTSGLWCVNAGHRRKPIMRP